MVHTSHIKIPNRTTYSFFSICLVILFVGWLFVRPALIVHAAVCTVVQTPDEIARENSDVATLYGSSPFSFFHTLTDWKSHYTPLQVKNRLMLAGWIIPSPIRDTLAQRVIDLSTAKKQSVEQSGDKSLVPSTGWGVTILRPFHVPETSIDRIVLSIQQTTLPYYRRIEQPMNGMRHVFNLLHQQFSELLAPYKWVFEDADYRDSCTHYASLIRPVYAATIFTKKKDQCVWYLQAPVRGVVRVVAPLLKGLGIGIPIGGVIVEIGTRVYFYAELMNSGNHILPSPESFQAYLRTTASCGTTSCAEGCLAGYECSASTQCCTVQKNYTDTICSSDNTVEIQREAVVNTFAVTGFNRCDSRGCVNTACLGYLKDVNSLPPCDNKSLWTYPTITSWQYAPVETCRLPSGLIGYRMGLSVDYEASLSCSDDHTSILSKDGDLVYTCRNGSACVEMPVPGTNGIANCYLPSEIQNSGVCIPGMQMNDGFTCDANGVKHCTPGAKIAPSVSEPCEQVCNDDGESATRIQPLRCMPTVENYEDITCGKFMGGNAVYTSNPITGDSSVYDVCGTASCMKGMCAQRPGSSCTNTDELVMRTDGTCLMRCQDHTWQNIGACGHVTVYSYNNRGIKSTYTALSKLPDFFFEGIHIPFRDDYTKILSFNDVLQEEYDGEAVRRKYAAVGNVQGEGDSAVVIHEFFHNWAFNYTNTVSPIVNASTYLLEVHDKSDKRVKTYAPDDYIQLTHCDDPAKQLPTVRDYGKTNCAEDFAVHAEAYVETPCDLHGISEERYDYFYKLFRGKEYVPQAGCR
jgi:hypothetical protein